MKGSEKKRVGFVVGNYHTDHPSRLVHMIWELLRDEDVELQVFLGTESASFIHDFAMRSSRFDYQYASLCGYTEYEDLDLLIISAGTLSIYQNAIPLDEFLRHTPDIPMILTETDRQPKAGISLIADNEQGLASCVEHLITAHGLTRIGFIAGPENNKDAEERFAGYRNTLEKHGIPFREEYVVTGDYSEHVDRSVEHLLDRAPELQAIASANDEMTGLYNRAGLVSARESMTAERPRAAAVIMADLDHLKQINDRFGHHEGDIALRSVADILRQVLGAGQVIGRIGGDEFQACFVQPSEKALKEQIRRIKARCDRYNEQSERPYFLEISLGYAIGTAQTREDWEALAARADEKLYEAKKQRRDFVIR